MIKVMEQRQVGGFPAPFKMSFPSAGYFSFEQGQRKIAIGWFAFARFFEQEIYASCQSGEVEFPGVFLYGGNGSFHG